MDYFISFTRYMLPVLALIILAKCVLTLLLGHPVNKTYGYIINRLDGEKIPLNMWETSIGRSNSCDITINYDTVSRFQAVISRRADGWYIFDTMSRSGIKVNGKKIDRRAVIKHGDALMFGDKGFLFAVADDPVIQVGKKNKKGKAPVAAPLPNNTAAASAASATRPQYVKPQPSVIPQNPGARIAPISDDEKFNIDIRKKPDAPGVTSYTDMTSQQRAQASPSPFPAGRKKEPAVKNTDTDEIYILCGTEVVIGRGRGSDIGLSDTTVSRRHAVLRKYSDGWGIEDAGSKYGTTLNGKKITVPQLLFDGDSIGVLQHKFRYYSDYKQGK